MVELPLKFSAVDLEITQDGNDIHLRISKDGKKLQEFEVFANTQDGGELTFMEVEGEQ